MSPEISADTVVKRSEEVVQSEVDGEVLAMSVDTGRYYAMTDSAVSVWKALDSPITVAELCDRLVTEYAVDRGACERDVLTFACRLAEEGLLEVGLETDTHGG